MPTNPDALVSTDWVAEHLDDPDLVLAEVDEDATAYDKSHIAGAVGFDWQADFQDPVRRTFLGPEAFARLLGSRGVGPDTHVVLYGGNNNWFAAYAYWYLKVYGHARVSLMDGGRKLWELQGRPLSDETVARDAVDYPVREADPHLRARRDEILSRYVGAPEGTALLDVRSPAEFAGDVLAPPSFPQEAAMVPGQIPRRGQRAVGEGGRPRHRPVPRSRAAAVAVRRRGRDRGP